VSAGARERAADVALYVYGIVPAGALDEPLGAGVAPGPVTSVEQDRLAALVSEVPLADYDEHALETNLRDPHWLERNVRAHEAVLESVAGRMPLVPFRFGTIFRGEESVRRMLGERADLVQTLERLADAVELGVKGFLDARGGHGGSSEAAGGRESGRAYLQRKQAALDAEREASALATELARESHERLAAVAADARANALQPPEASPAGEAMFLNGAYLVVRGGEQAFRGTVDGLGRAFAARGARYEVTGPWPAYNFVDEPVGP